MFRTKPIMLKWRFIKYLVFAFLVSNFIGCTTSKPPEKCRKPSKQFYRSGLLSRNFTGFIVYDAEKDKILFEYNSDHYFTPASNTKLMTFYAGLHALGDSIPGMEYCILHDTLFFGGTGDPTLLNPAFKRQPVFAFLKSDLRPLAYFPNRFEDERFGPGWSWDDYPFYFSQEKAVFPVYGNTVHINFSDSLNAFEIIPGFFARHTTLIQDSLVDKTRISRAENENVFEIAYSGRQTESEDEIPFRYSESLMLQLLQDTLKKEVFYVKNKPSCTTRILYSRPADSVFRQMLRVSDNFVAEQILLMSSYTLFDTLNSARMIRFAREHYLPGLDSGSRWVDGSGLSRYNQFTPRDMVLVLKNLYRELPRQRLFTLMPHGDDIRLTEHVSGEGDHYLYAKTGSMSYVNNLSGYMVTKSGKILIFSFMNNNFAIPPKIIRQEMAEVLQAFRERY